MILQGLDVVVEAVVSHLEALCSSGEVESLCSVQRVIGLMNC